MALPVCLLVLSILSLCSSSQLPGLFQNNGNQFQSPFTFVRDGVSGEKVPSHGHTIQTRTEIIESKPVFVRHEISPDVKDIEEFHIQHNSEEQRLRTGVEFQPLHNSQEFEGKRLRTGQQFNNKVDFIKSFNNIHVSDGHLLTAGQALENQENNIQQFFSNHESEEEKSRTFSLPQIQENVVHFHRENKKSEAQILTSPQQLQNQVSSFQHLHSDLESEDERFKVGQQIPSQFVMIPHFQHNRESEEQRARTDQQFQNQAIDSHALHGSRELNEKRLKSNERFQVHVNQPQHFRAHVPSKIIENTVPFSVIRTFTDQWSRTHQPFQNKAIAVQSFHDSRESEQKRLKSGGRFQIHANQVQHLRNDVSSKEIKNDIPLSIVKTFPVFRDVVTEVSNFQIKENAHETFKEEDSVENHEDIGSSNILQSSPSFTDTERLDESRPAAANIHMTNSEEESERWFRHHQKKFFDSLALENRESSENQFQSFDKTIKLNSVGHILNSPNLFKQNSQSFVDESVESLNDRAVIQYNLLQQTHQPFSERLLKPPHETFSSSQESSQQNFEDSQELLTNHHSLIQKNLKFDDSSENFASRTIPDEQHLQSFEDSSKGFVEPRIIVQQNLDSIDQSNKWFSRYQQAQGQLGHQVQEALFIRMEGNKDNDGEDDDGVHVQGEIDNHDHKSESKENFIAEQNDKHNFQPSFHSFPGNKIHQEVQNQFLNPVVQPTFQSHVEHFSEPKQKAHPNPQLISQPYFQPHNSLPFKQTFTPQLKRKSNFQSQIPQVTNTLPFATNLQPIDQSNHNQKPKINLHPKFEDLGKFLHTKKPQIYIRTQSPNSNLLESREDGYVRRNQLSQFSEPIEYKYKFTVHDSRRGTNFGKEEERLGLNTQGYYYVHLPDGRLQKVFYFVEGESGYKADVQYDGKARFSRANVYYK